MSQRTGRSRFIPGPNPWAGIQFRDKDEIPALASRPVRSRFIPGPNPWAEIQFRDKDEIPALASRSIRSRFIPGPNPWAGIQFREEKEKEQKAPEQQQTASVEQKAQEQQQAASFEQTADVIPENAELEQEYGASNFRDRAFDYSFCDRQMKQYQTEMKRDYRKPGESMADHQRARFTAQTQFHYWQPLVYFKSLQLRYTRIAQTKQEITDLKATNAPTQEAEQRLRTLEAERDRLQKDVRVAISNKKKWDQHAAELKRRAEADQLQIPQQTAQEQKLGFDPVWFKDPEQLQWNTTTALMYFNNQKDRYIRTLEWQVEGFVPAEQIVYYVRMLQARTLLIRAALLTAQRQSPTTTNSTLTVIALEDYMRKQTRLLQKWIPQLPPDAQQEIVPDAEDLDTRWFLEADLKRPIEEIRKQAREIKKQMDALSASNKAQPSIQNSRQLQMQANRHQMLLTLCCYRLVENAQKAQAEDVMLRPLSEQFAEANQTLRATLTGQDVPDSSDIPDVVLTSLKQTPEPTLENMKRRRVDAEEAHVASEKHTLLRQYRQDLSAARKRLAALEAASDENAESTRDSIRLLIRQAHAVYNELKSEPSIKAEFPEFEQVAPDAKLSVQDEPLVVRKPWNPPDAATVDEFTADDWKRSTNEDKKLIAVCACVFFV